MSIFREIPPTAGFPLRAKDFLSLFKGKTYSASLEDDFKNYLGVFYAKVTCSGTAGLYLICESLKAVSSRKTVIIPSYICPSVPLAIKRAGLNIRVCDINRYDFNFNLGQLEAMCRDDNDILAVLVTHLGGIPLDFDAVEKIVRQRRIFIVEDCAQALGASYKGKKAGTLGDFSFFSLARGKGLTIYEGGVVVANKRGYAPVIDAKIKELVKDDFFSEGLKILELLGYWIFYRPRLFWFVYKLPEIFWKLKGERYRAAGEYFTVDFPLHKVWAIRKLIGHINFYRLEEELKRQREAASCYIGGLGGAKAVNVVKEPPYGIATYPYLFLIFDDPEKRNRIFKILGNLGLGVSEVYTLPVTGYDYLKQIISDKDCPNGRYLSQRQITLSTNLFLKRKDLDRILDIIDICDK